MLNKNEFIDCDFDFSCECGLSFDGCKIIDILDEYSVSSLVVIECPCECGRIYEFNVEMNNCDIHLGKMLDFENE